jgi:hypothetical protein
LPYGGKHSSYVAGLLLADIPNMMLPSVVVILYMDNLLILARSKGEIDEAAASLTKALINHSTGRLHPRHSVTGDLTKKPCAYLGYDLDAPNGKPRTRLSAKTWLRISRAWMSASTNDAKNCDFNVSQTHKCLENRLLNAFPHAEDRFELYEDLLVGTPNLVETAQGFLGKQQIDEGRTFSAPDDF